MPLPQPQALVDKLSRYKKSLEEVDLREKQLAAMRIDICNAENLKKLKGACFHPQTFTFLCRHPHASLSHDRPSEVPVSLSQIRPEGKSFQRTSRKGAHNCKSSSSSLTVIVELGPR